MRFEHGDVSYLGESWGELADLVSWDGEPTSHELPEDVLIRLYEAGRWWSSASVRKRPGVRGLLDEIREGARPYMLVQELRDGDCEVRLRDYLLEGAASSKREGTSLLVETGHQAFELWYGGNTFTMDHALVLCERARRWILSGKLKVERLPPLLLEVAGEARASLLKNLIEVSHGQSLSGGTRACIHRVSGDEEVYIVAMKPASLLGPLGLRVEPSVDPAGGPHEGDKNSRMLASLIVFSDLIGDEAPILRYTRYPKSRMGVDDLSSVVLGELVLDSSDGAFIFSATPETPSRTMNLIRESLRHHKIGG